MKTGLFFGSFDPIHNGHLLKAVEALEKKLVDRVVFVPAKQNPWKPEPMFDYEKRVYMCSVAAHSLRFAMVGKDDGKILVSDIEGQMVGTTYTYEVLCKFKEEHPSEDICLICGTDVSLDIPKWMEGEKLLKEFEVITLNRGADEESDYPDLNISSTKIRELIKKNMSVAGLVPTEINHYLYSSTRNYGLI